jgi:hypothetical protein
VSRAEADVDELVAAARYALIVLEASPPIGYAHMWLTDALARVSGAGLTEAGGPPLTLVSPGTPSEPSASPAAETLGGRDVRGVDGHAPGYASRSSANTWADGAGTPGGAWNAESPAEITARRAQASSGAGIKPGRTSLAPDAGMDVPARGVSLTPPDQPTHGGPEDQAGAAAPACRCGHDAWDHTWRCTAQLAPDEWCDCIEWREA